MIAKDELPPHSAEAERAALACVLLAVTGLLPGMDAQGQAEQDQLLQQMRPLLFYTVDCQTMFAAMVNIRMEGHALNTLTLHQWLKDKKKLEDAGGTAAITTLVDAAPSVFTFPTFLGTLKDKALRRWTLLRRERLKQLAEDEGLSVEMLQAEFAEIHEKSSHIGGKSIPFINIISPKQAREFKPDPADNMLGGGLARKESMIVIAGKPGIGKSRLITTLAVAGARGNCSWMNYPVVAQWRSLILGKQNDTERIQEEYAAVPPEFDDMIRMSDKLSYGLAFDRPEFRRELRHFYEKWPFGMLGIDPWNDVTAEDGQADFKTALNNIESVFHGLPKRPLVVIVAHLRKSGRDANGKPKGGREILDELSGSLMLGSDARSVFSVSQATSDLQDPRVVFDVAKANNVSPEFFQKYGTRSAWKRANAAFESIQDFDWESYENPGEPERRAVSEEMIEAVLKQAGSLNQTQLAKSISKRFKIGESTVQRAIGEGGYMRHLIQKTTAGALELKGEK